MDVKPILSFAAAALLLAGCAGVYDKSAAAPVCKSGADHTASLRMFGPGLLMSGGHVIPARNLGASGKLDKDWGNVPCIRENQNGTHPPKSYDVHKIGMLL